MRAADLYAYGDTLADGEVDGLVRRLGMKADWDVTLLAQTVEFARKQHNTYEDRRTNGLYMAFIKALAQAEEQAYRKRRNQRRRRHGQA